MGVATRDLAGREVHVDASCGTAVVERVDAGTAEEPVGAGTTRDDIVAAEGVEAVVAGAADKALAPSSATSVSPRRAADVLEARDRIALGVAAGA